AQGSREDLDAWCASGGQTFPCLLALPAQPVQLDGVREDGNRAGEAKAAKPLLLGLARGVAECALPPAVLLQLAPAEEVGKGVIQMVQGFLRRALGHRIHPGYFGLRQQVQFLVEVNRRGTPARLAVLILPALQAPPVRPARRARMLATGCDLPVVDRQLGIIGTDHEHLAASSLTLAWWHVPTLVHDGHTGQDSCWLVNTQVPSR